LLRGFFEEKPRRKNNATQSLPQLINAKSAIQMNNQVPLVPKGSLEQKDKGRARVKVAVFFVLAVHAVGLMALLLQAGCRQQNTTTDETANTSTPPPETAISTSTNTNTEATTPPPVIPTNTASTEITGQPPVTTPPPTPPPTVSTLPTEYTVVAGDTPAGIVKKFNNQFKLQALLDANPKLKPTAMHAGDKLKLPPPTAPKTGSPTSTTPPVSSEGAGREYKVKSGDNLTSIATSHGTTVKALRAENNLKTDRITVGQVLMIPAKAAVAAPVTPLATDSISALPSGH
jgi:LysM repeat protein